MDKDVVRLLIVDDEPSILELLSTALESLGNYKVTTAESGAQALRLIKADGPIFDCILLDIQMPELNGIDVCAEIRRKSLYRHVPIIMLTAMSDIDYVERAFKLGATDYVTKPFNFEDLRTRVGHAHRLFRARLMPTAETMDSDVKPSTPEPVVAKTVKFDAAVELEGIDRVLGAQRFENYVRQMLRSKAKYTSAFAVKVSNAYFIHKAVSGPEFVKVMGKIADCISGATEENGSLISYQGRGIFLCLEYGTRISNTSDLGLRINTELSEMQIGRIRPSVIVSKHVELEETPHGTAAGLLRDAMMTVETPNLEKLRGEKKLVPAPSHRPAESQTRLSEWRACDTQVYRELFGAMLKQK
ncbi:response regulator [Marimonas lutisalis]|uniref:response regulator n=1 Tax=Marimonas lutisalis TaxID=2545756 RepID=UPI0010F82D1B|nr:response regulator [Marimonas lutisalis]